MYRIRLHGRGGQGIKTASRILGSALFAHGFEVQDAPHYGAERRGAPLFACVRADRSFVLERGPIERPDLVVVADESLVQVPAAGVMAGLDDHAVLIIASAESPETWRGRLGLSGAILTLTPDVADAPDATGNRMDAALVGTMSAGAAARVLGVISPEALEAAARSELEALAPELIERNVACLQRGYEAFAEHAGCVVEGAKLSRSGAPVPEWVELEVESTAFSAPDIHGGATSELVPTGLWRTMRPEIDYSLCRRCSWICSTFCPDAAIDVGPERQPIIDYDHCKGCLLCAAVCPTHAIRIEPESAAVAVLPRERSEDSGEAGEGKQ
jgi:pyruvate ferredoxin oxidoreductase gamma subunit